MEAPAKVNMSLIKASRLLILATALIMAASVRYRYLMLIDLAILLAYRDYIMLQILSIIHPVQPPLIVRENYVYDPLNRLMHIFYKATPLYGLANMEPDRYLSLINEISLRLSTYSNAYVTFIVKGSDIVIRLTAKDEPPFIEALQTFEGLERMLGEYFILRRLKGGELASLVKQRPCRLGRFTIPTALASLILIAIYGLPGLAYGAALAGLTIYYLLAPRVVCSGEGYRYVSVRDRHMFSKYSASDLYSLAKAFQGSVNEYAIVINGSSRLPIQVPKEYDKASESLVVKERGVGYVKVIQWRNVIDRLSSGETPLRILILLKSRNVPGLADCSQSRLADYAYWAPEGFMVDALSGDLAIYMPFKASTIGRGGRVVKLGFDELGNEVYLDLDSLPSGHMIIVGPTGMGKSWAMRSILSKLIALGLRPIVIDPHGEYGGLGLRVVNVDEYFLDVLSLGDRDELALAISYAIIDSFKVSEPEVVFEDVDEAIKLSGSFRDLFERLPKLTLSVELRNIYRLIGLNLGRRGYVEPPEVLKGVVFNLKPIIRNPGLTTFATLMIMEHLYRLYAPRRSPLSNVLVVDEAYYVMGSRLLELYVRGLRKSGLGVILITQNLDDADRAILQNIQTIVALGGPDSYVLNMGRLLMLNKDDLEWLKLGIAPHLTNGLARALIVQGPVRRRVFIELDQALKPENGLITQK